MSEDNTRVYFECIRVSLRLVGQLSYKWIWDEVSSYHCVENDYLCENDPKSDMVLLPLWPFQMNQTSTCPLLCRRQRGQWTCPFYWKIVKERLLRWHTFLFQTSIIQQNNNNIIRKIIRNVEALPRIRLCPVNHAGKMTVTKAVRAAANENKALAETN